jgi:hypothetical protein
MGNGQNGKAPDPGYAVSNFLVVESVLIKSTCRAEIWFVSLGQSLKIRAGRTSSAEGDLNDSACFENTLGATLQ